MIKNIVVFSGLAILVAGCGQQAPINKLNPLAPDAGGSSASGPVSASYDSASEKGKTPRERAEAAAASLAKQAAAKNVKAVVFDRGGFQYLGTIKAFADAARAAGLEF